jgi:predicted ester cyclase
MGSDADIIRRITNEAFIGGNPSVIDELVADNFVDHDPPPGFSADRDGARQMAELVISAFTDRKIEFDDYDETSDGCVVESWAMTGTHTGEAFGMPPSNQSVRVRGIEIWRCAGGKVTEHWGAVDLSDVAEKAVGG